MLPRWQRALDRWPSRISAFCPSRLRLRNRFDEVGIVIPAALELLDHLALGRVGDAAIVGWAHQIAIGAVEHVADFGAEQVRMRETVGPQIVTRYNLYPTAALRGAAAPGY